MTESERAAEARRKAEEGVAKEGGGDPQTPSPRPNIKLREGATPPTTEGEFYPTGGKPILLPNLDAQKAGFYHERATEIIRHYPDRYIPFTDKGGK